MTNDLNKPIYALMLAMTFLTSCNGQVGPIMQKENDLSQMGQAKIPRPKGANKDVRIVAGMEDKDGNLWFGSVSEGLFKYDGKLFVHFGIEQGLNSNRIYSVLQDKTGNVWVGTNKGLNRLDGNKFVSIPIALSYNNSSQLNNVYISTPTENTVWSMMQDRNGIIWFGTDDGVYCHNARLNDSVGQGNAFSRFLDKQTVINKELINTFFIVAMILRPAH